MVENDLESITQYLLAGVQKHGVQHEKIKGCPQYGIWTAPYLLGARRIEAPGACEGDHDELFVTNPDYTMETTS